MNIVMTRSNATKCAGALLALTLTMGPFSGTAQAATLPPLSRAALANAAYPITFAGGAVQLVDGVFEDAENRTRVTLGTQRANGDLNRDGAIDSAVVLSVNTGGTGTFTVLSAVVNVSGTAKPVDVVALGDRVTVRSLRITTRGELLVTYLDRRPGQPMIARPTVPVSLRFRLLYDALVATTALSERALANATYQIEGTQDGLAPLINGKYEDLEANTVVTLARRPRATGDMDGNTSPDTAVLLAEKTAGSGAFSWVSVVLNDRYTEQPVMSHFIGDRVVVQSMSIRDRILTVRYLDRKAGEPLSARPSVAQTRRLMLVNWRLVDQDRVGPPLPPTPGPPTTPITPTTAVTLTTGVTPTSAVTVLVPITPAVTITTTRPVTPSATVTATPPMTTPAAMADILAVLAADKRFSTLAAAVNAAGLTQTLSGPGPFTVFAPTNDAFAALDQGALTAMLKGDVGQVRDILLYHVLPGNALTAKMITPDLKAAGTALPRAAVAIQARDGGVTLDGRARVSQADIAAGNGVIHVIDAVLLPPMRAGARLALDGRFAILGAAVRATGLAELLDMQLADFTLFAPTDAAFAKLPARVLSDTLADKKALTDLVLNHIVSPTLKAADVVKQTELKTLSGGALPVMVDGAKVTVKGASVLEADIRLTGGLLHVIDAVLTPGAAAAGAPAFSGVVTGTVTYRQRIALPPNAVIQVQLADVSRADAAATVLASQTITAEGKQVPFAFTLQYDPAKIDDRLTYAVSARITVDGRLMWINMARIPALTRGAPRSGIEVLVEPTP